MCSVPLSVMLLLLWLRIFLADPQCERSSAVRVSVSSWRNQTGHRLIAAAMRSDDSQEDAVSLSVEQWTERCGAANTVALSLTTSSAKSTSAAITTPVPTTPVPATPITTTSVTARPTPGPEYRHLPGHGHYKKHDTTMSWEEGRRICESEGAHLAVFETKEEFDAVYDFSGCCPWIGVYRHNGSSPWITVLGEPLETSGFAGWLPGFPSGSADCVLLDRSTVRGINNFRCSTPAPVICEGYA